MSHFKNIIATTNNTAVGYRSLSSHLGKDNTSPYDQGLQNAALGAYSLQSNTTGAGNVAVGYKANDTQASPYKTVATGWYSLASGTQSISIGSSGLVARRTTASANKTIAIGTDSTGSPYTQYGNSDIQICQATASDCIAMGTGAQAVSSPYGIAIGKETYAAGFSYAVGDEGIRYGAVAIGNRSQALGGGSIAIGFQGQQSTQFTRALDTDCIAIGTDARAGLQSAYGNHIYCISVGNYAVSQGRNSIAIGATSSATPAQPYGNAIAIGNLTTANFDSAIAIGRSADADRPCAVAIGDGANAEEDECIAIGRNAFARQDRSIAIGYRSTTGTTSPYNIAIGSASSSSRSTRAYGQHTIAIGTDDGNTRTETSGECSIAIGTGVRATANYTINIGCKNSGASNAYEICIGYNCIGSGGSVAIGKDCIAGPNAGATGRNVAIGYQATIADIDNRSVAIGYNATIGVQNAGTQSICIGSNAEVKANTSVAIGPATYVDTDASDAVAIGNGAKVYNSHSSSIAIGQGTVTNTSDGLFCAQANNTITASAANLYINGSNRIGTTSSSAKSKENIVELTQDDLQIVDNLRPVRFTFKEDGTPSIGFIAEEVESLLPEVIVRDSDNEIKTIRYPLLTSVLTHKVKNQQSRIVQLENTVTDLQQQLDAVKQHVGL